MKKQATGTLHRSPSAPSAVEDASARLLAAAAQAHAAGNLEQTRQLCLRVLERDPRHADALHLLALEEYSAQRLPQALNMMRRALALQPANAALHANHAAILRAAGDAPAALAAARQAVHLDPAFAAAHNNLGLVLYDLKQDAEAEAAFRRALALCPNLADAHANLAAVLLRVLQPEEALEHAWTALERMPEWAVASNSTALALVDLNRPAEALPHAQRAVSLEPNKAQYRFLLGMVELQLGDFEQGWRNHEARRGMPAIGPRELPEPLWLGQPLHGERILLHAEQGLGDSLQFLRYAPLIAEAGGAVVLDLPRRLHRLAASLPGVVEITAALQLSAPCAWQCPLMSLPLAFGTRLATIPARVPYLAASAQALAEAKALLWPAQGLRVGLAWSGNPDHTHDKLRSLSLEQLESLLALPGAHFFSLQLDADPAALARYGIHNLAPASGDMDDTAARMEQLDLILTVDTAVAHLAGALGRRCWMLDRHAGDARWLLNRSDSPWYPTLTLYRQPTRGDWPTVLARVHRDLQALIATAAQLALP